jgi:ribosome-binding factor A
MTLKTSYRIERISEAILRELVLVLKQKIKDPRLQNLVITDVIVSRDLGNAKVFYNGMEHNKNSTLKLLNNVSGFFRTHLSKNLDLHHVPRLRFVYDSSLSAGLKIEQLLKR